MSPLPVLKTERLILRPFEDRDAPEIVALDSDPEVMRYLGETGTTTEEALEFIEHARRFPEGVGFWIAEHDGRFIGWFHLRPARSEPHEMELGFRLRREAWGHGFGTEGSVALLRHAWDVLDAPSVMASTDVENLGSRRVMEKVGMTFVEEFLYEGQFPSVRYRVLRPN